MSLHLKLKFGEEVRRIAISPEDLHNLNLPSLHRRVQGLYDVQQGSFNIQFVDSQNKAVLLQTEANLEEALRTIHMASPNTPLTMIVLPRRSLTDSELISEFSQIFPSNQPSSIPTSSCSSSPPLVSETSRTEKNFEEELFEVLMTKANDFQQFVSEALPRAQKAFEELQSNFEKMVGKDRNECKEEALKQQVVEEKKEEAKGVAHPAYCNVCEADIFGIRYKCTVCYDYDLCEKCDAKRIHDPSHNFLRLLEPQHVEETSAPAMVPISQYDAQFVSDVTVPDGTEVQPGEQFTKIWAVKNTCNYTWPEGTSLHFMGGARVNDTEYAVLSDTVQPGATVNIALSCTAPSAFGEHTSYWQVYHPIAERGFGDRLWVRVKVTDAALENALDLLEGMGFERSAVLSMMQESGFDIKKILEMVGLN